MNADNATVVEKTSGDVADVVLAAAPDVRNNKPNIKIIRGRLMDNTESNSKKKYARVYAYTLARNNIIVDRSFVLLADVSTNCKFGFELTEGFEDRLEECLQLCSEERGWEVKKEKSPLRYDITTLENYRMVVYAVESLISLDTLNLNQPDGGENE